MQDLRTWKGKSFVVTGRLVLVNCPQQLMVS
jgi:hypothetical protein